MRRGVRGGDDENAANLDVTGRRKLSLCLVMAFRMTF